MGPIGLGPNSPGHPLEGQPRREPANGAGTCISAGEESVESLEKKVEAISEQLEKWTQAVDCARGNQIPDRQTTRI